MTTPSFLHAVRYLLRTASATLKAPLYDSTQEREKPGGESTADTFHPSKKGDDKNEPTDNIRDFSKYKTEPEKGEVPTMRRKIEEKIGKGIDGSGVKVVVLEGESGNVTDEDQGDHAAAVRSVISHHVFGIAPGASTEIQTNGVNYQDLPDYAAKYGDNEDGLKKYITDFSRDSVDKLTNYLRGVSDDPNRPRVINYSWGASRTFLYNDIYNELYPKGKTDEVKEKAERAKLPGMRQAIFGDVDDSKLSRQERLQKVIDYVDRVLDENPEQLQDALHNYCEVTRELAQKGIILVTITGNDHDIFQKYDLKTKAGCELNWTAMSPYVISVGSSEDVKNTPADHSDDIVASHSSRGDDKQNNPTILAPGVGVHVTNSSKKEETGTSFAAPYVSGTIALMLQVNPNLTFEEIKQILQSTATQIPAASLAEQGTGIVNPVGAIEAARFLKKINI